MTNIIRACSYVAGIDSLGIRSLKSYHTELTGKQIEKLDPLNANNGLPAWYILRLTKAKPSKKTK